MKAPLSFAAAGTPQQNRQRQAEALFQQALQLHQGGQHQAALPLYEQVIQLHPRHSDALHLAGVLRLQAGDPEQAIDLITRCIKIDRQNASAHANRGAACQALGQLELAMLNFNKAIEFNPRLDSGWNNRANLLMRLERNTEALSDLDEALRLNPASFEAHTNRGNALSRLGRHAEATRSYERAVELAPHATASRWSLGMNLQGLGDPLQFSRFAKQVHERGARVLLEVQPELVELLSRACPFAQVVSSDRELPPFSHSCPLLSLPLVLRTQPDQIPPPTPGVTASADQMELWQTRLGERRALRVGVVWSGNPDHVDDAQRSIPLSTFKSLFCEGIDWISLHKDVRASDQPALDQSRAIRSFGERLRSFSDPAALIAQLDLVICVVSSVALLAGTLGKETWLLLPFNPDWRW